MSHRIEASDLMCFMTFDKKWLAHRGSSYCLNPMSSIAHRHAGKLPALIVIMSGHVTDMWLACTYHRDFHCPLAVASSLEHRPGPLWEVRG